MPRRGRLLALTVAGILAGAACGGRGVETVRDGAPAPPAERSIAALLTGAQRLDLLTAQSHLTPGSSLFTFGMVTSRGDLLTGGSPQVWLAKDQRTPAAGPFTATYERFRAYERFPNKAPRPVQTGFYAAQVELPAPGRWEIAAVARSGTANFAAVSAVEVLAQGAPAQVGTKAPATPTPVAATDSARRKICTREPPDPLHYISLDEALRNGKPTVITFGTPLLCESRMCGPVVDEVLLVHERVGRSRANFIHLEVYPQRDQSRPAPQLLQWRFPSEPWTVVIDRKGTIRARFEGPVVAPQIQEALQPLL